MIDFSCDYNVGAAQEIIDAIVAVNNDVNKTYGYDYYCKSAAAKIKMAVRNANAEVWFLVGGTQTNEIALSAMMKSYEGVICASSGHIAVHEAGAIESSSHKVIAIDGHSDGRINIDSLRSYMESFYADPSHDHMVQPGVVYITHPTEYGGLYSVSEIEEIRKICDKYSMKLYLDGARLAYGLAAVDTDVKLSDLGRLCDAFYIGGTKCGSLFGEALVFKSPCEKFFTHRKQHGGLLAKGWLLGLQFDALFSNGLYERLGLNAIDKALSIKQALIEKGIEFFSDSWTNQQFVLLSDEQLAKLDGVVRVDFWGKQADKNLIRICTSWKTSDEDVDVLLSCF